MTESAWHASNRDLREYLDGTITVMHAASVEAHLLGCESCRQSLATVRSATAEPGPDRVWAAISERIDRPTHPLLRWHDGHLRTLFATAPLLAATLGAVALVLLAPLAAHLTSVRAGVTALFAVAPLAPLVGVVLAFRPSAEPAGELGLAAPMTSMRLLTARAAAVGVAALPAGLLASALIPVETGALLGWILPGIAFTALTMAAGTRMDPSRAAVALALGWSVVVGSLAADLRTEPVRAALSDWVVNQAPIQMTMAVVAVVAALLTVHRDGALVSWEDR